jgi:hypothetical protein
VRKLAQQQGLVDKRHSYHDSNGMMPSWVPSAQLPLGRVPISPSFTGEFRPAVLRKHELDVKARWLSGALLERADQMEEMLQISKVSWSCTADLWHKADHLGIALLGVVVS